MKRQAYGYRDMDFFEIIFFATFASCVALRR